MPKIFLHIPKTAGGTLKRALREATNLNVEFVYSNEDKSRIAESEASEIDLVYGHAAFGVHDRIGLPDTTGYMCFMRHPLSRTISHYYHLRNVDRGRLGDKIRSSDNINDFFARLKHREFNNLMCRAISGSPVGERSDDEWFEAAAQNIDRSFEFIGFQEFLPMSLKRLSEVLGTSIVIQKDVNVGRYSQKDVTDETVAQINALNGADLRIYRYAVSKFLT